ncbi:MAG: PilZ domain-containing protein, partial [Stenotrophomonas indicatrix]
MSTQPPVDTRRAPRRQVSDLVPVTDQMRDSVVGRLGNVSETGMLMLASATLRDDALYQLRFPLPSADGRSEWIDVGVHLLWSEPAHAPGQ